MLYSVLQFAYIGILGALSTMTMFRGVPAMRRTVYCLIAVALASYAYLWAFGDDFWWSVYMITVNAVACRIITWKPAGKWQSMIGQTYILQICVHTGRLLNWPDINPVAIWWGLSIMAFAQLGLLGGWWLHARRDHHRIISRDSRVASTSDQGRMVG